MNGLAAWDDEELQRHVGYKTKISHLLKYIETVNSRVSDYEIADRLSYGYASILSNIQEKDTLSMIKKDKALADLYKSGQVSLFKLWKDKNKTFIKQDSTSLLKLIDEAYAKSIKPKTRAEIASLHDYIVKNDIQSGFDESL